MRAVVVGGGLAGLAAALDLVDAGHEVTLLEARPTLGGAVQTLPRREGDPEPPPDNGQHIALGCFTEYLGFLERIGRGGAVRRTGLALPVIDERGRVATIRPGSARCCATATSRCASGSASCARSSACAGSSRDGDSFAEVLRRLGQSERAVDRFWDVFLRPALNLPARQASAAMGLVTVRTALLGPRGSSDLVLPLEPLGEMHGAAAGAAL